MGPRLEVLQIISIRSQLQLTATQCSTHLHALNKGEIAVVFKASHSLQLTATHCNTLQLAATQCNTLQRTATRCNALQRTATHCNAL